ncbi:MAG: peptidoglycan-binding protein, partial [Bacillota bacterium]
GTDQEPLIVDGVYGGNTKSAVAELQKEFGITADGAVGIETYSNLLHAINVKNGGSIPPAKQSDVSYSTQYELYGEGKYIASQLSKENGTGNTDKYGNPILYDRNGNRIDPDVVYLIYNSPFSDGFAHGMFGSSTDLVDMSQYPEEWMKDLFDEGYAWGEVGGAYLVVFAGAASDWSSVKKKDSFYKDDFYAIEEGLSGIEAAKANSGIVNGGTPNTKPYTKSSLKMGQEKHKAYKADIADNITKFKEFRLPSGKRIDYIDFETKTIYELKPYNPNGIKSGTKQLDGYLKEVESIYGDGWKTVLDTY